MSASASKKKRKELEEQGLSAKDVAARKEKEKKSRQLRNLLIVVLAVAVALAAVFAVIKLVNRPSYDLKAPAATVGEEKITVPMYDYFYNLTASNFYNSYSFLIQDGVPLSQQSSFFGGDGTLEDYMKDTTNSSLREIFNVCAKAKADGYQLSGEQQDSIKEALDSLKTEAATYGFSNADKYLAARFGEGCNTDNYEEYMKVFLTYTGYANRLNEEFKPTVEEITAAYVADRSAYDLVNFTYATSAAEAEKTEAKTPDANVTDGETTAATEAPASTDPVYTDEAKAAAKAKAEEYLKEMPEDATTTSYNKDSVNSYFNEDIANWLFDDARKDGDVQVFPKDEKETYFYAVRFNSRDTNDYCLINANIISVAKDKEDAEIKEGEQSAKEKFDALVAAVKEGMSDEDFSKAVTALSYSDSTTSVSRTYSLEEIRDFLFDENRKEGDLLTSYENDTAYYLVRYASTDDETYRDTMVKNKLWNTYYEGIATANEIKVDEELLKHANTDLTFHKSNTEQ